MQRNFEIFIFMKKIIGAGILAFDKKTGRTLLARRGLKGSEPNCWAPFGGTHEEKDEIPRNTAIREFREESGCDVPYSLSKKPFYINDDNHVKFYTYLALFDEQFPVKINAESLDYEWFDVNLLPDNLHPGVKELFEEKKEDIQTLIRHFLNHGL